MADEQKNGDDAASEWAAMIGDEPNADQEEMSEEERAMMAQWETAAEEPAEGVSVEPARVLNQDEIDLLLGFDSGPETKESDSGLEAILGKSHMAYEKLPMLEVVFDRLVRDLSSSLRGFTSDNVDVSIDSMTSMRFESYLNSIPLPALLVVFRAVEWENFGLITVDSSLIYSVVDVLLGGRRYNRPIRVEGRPYTTIEQDIVKRLVDVVLHEMSVAFDPLSPVTFQHERLENNPRFATITRPNNAALLVRLRVDMEERGGNIEILIPHATLEPIRDLLTQIFMGENFGQDAVWEKHLGNEIRQTYIDIEAVLDEKIVPMRDVLAFKVGTTLLLDCSANAEITLRCGEVGISKGKLGRMGDKMAVSITQPPSRQTQRTNAKELM